jgi:hypothetical protein
MSSATIALTKSRLFGVSSFMFCETFLEVDSIF